MTPEKLYYVWEYNDVDRAFWAEHLKDFLPHKIIDAHTHVWYGDLRREEMTEEKRRQYWVNELVEAITPEEAKRCYDIVFPGKDLNCLAFGQVSYDWDIDAIEHRLEKDVPALGWTRLAVIKPNETAEEVDRKLDAPATIGVKVYYDLIGYDPTSRDKYIEASIFDFIPHHQLEVLNRRRAWLTLHVPKAGRLGHPDNIREIKELREKYPDIILVIAHLGRCYTMTHAKEAFEQLAGDDGLYFDNCAVLNPDVHKYALETFGPDRILYGTDNPIFYMRGCRQWSGDKYVNRTNYPFYFNKEREAPEIEAGYTLFMYEAIKGIKDACECLSLSRVDVEKIFCNNAEKLMSIANRG